MNDTAHTKPHHVEGDLDQARAGERSEMRRRALVRAMARIRHAHATEAQQAQLAHVLGTSPGPYMVEDVVEQLRELREEYEAAHENAEEYRAMWAQVQTRAEQQRLALSRAVALLRRHREAGTQHDAFDQ